MTSAGRATADAVAADEPYGVDVLAPAYQAPGAAPLYHMSRDERLKGLANRFVHSRWYLYLYATMAALSLVTVVLSLWGRCPGVAFYVLELLINVALVAEVSVRLVAFGPHFWDSTLNVVDLGLVVLCLVTLLLLVLGHGCSPLSKRTGAGEELLDSVLLIVRNVVQCMRLLSVVRRSGYSMTSRVASIDLNDAHAYSLGLDWEEESSQVLQRMQAGGDARGGGRGWTPQAHPLAGPAAPSRDDSIIAMDASYVDEL